jgi:hypothetical protein
MTTSMRPQPLWSSHLSTLLWDQVFSTWAFGDIRYSYHNIWSQADSKESQKNQAKWNKWWQGLSLNQGSTVEWASHGRPQAPPAADRPGNLLLTVSVRGGGWASYLDHGTHLSNTIASQPKTGGRQESSPRLTDPNLSFFERMLQWYPRYRWGWTCSSLILKGSITWLASLDQQEWFLLSISLFRVAPSPRYLPHSHSPRSPCSGATAPTRFQGYSPWIYWTVRISQIFHVVSSHKLKSFLLSSSEDISLLRITWPSQKLGTVILEDIYSTLFISFKDPLVLFTNVMTIPY